MGGANWSGATADTDNCLGDYHSLLLPQKEEESTK